jgi:hypothetical protein
MLQTPQTVDCLHPHGWLRLETAPRHQQNCPDCHKKNARPVRSNPQESQAAPRRLQGVANRPGGIPAAKRSPPNSSAYHVQESAENEQRAKSDQEHSRLLNSSLPRTTSQDSSAMWCDSFRAPGMVNQNRGLWRARAGVAECFEHSSIPFSTKMNRQTCKKRPLKQTLLEALAPSLAESDYSTKSTGLPVLLGVFRPLGHIA